MRQLATLAAVCACVLAAAACKKDTGGTATGAASADSGAAPDPCAQVQGVWKAEVALAYSYSGLLGSSPARPGTAALSVDGRTVKIAFLDGKGKMTSAQIGWNTQAPTVEGAACAFAPRDTLPGDFTLGAVELTESPYSRITKLKLTPTKDGVELATESSDLATVPCRFSGHVKPDADSSKMCVDGHLAGEPLVRMQTYFKTLNGSFWTPSPSVGPGHDKPAKGDNAAAGSAAPRERPVSESAAIGDTVTLADSEWTVVDAKMKGKTLASNNQFQEPAHTEGKFIYVKFKVKNLTNKEDRILDHPKLIDGKGREFGDYDSATFYIKDGEKTLAMEALPPSMAKQFAAIYEVPDDAADFSFQARALSAFGGKKNIALGF